MSANKILSINTYVKSDLNQTTKSFIGNSIKALVYTELFKTIGIIVYENQKVKA